ncbi:MAG: hypothetical protein ACI4F3_03755 [Enterocloster sp.]
MMKLKKILGILLAAGMIAGSAVPVYAAENSGETYGYLAGKERSRSGQGLDAETLVEAGVIDQAAADSIKAYAASKHDKIHGRYEGMSERTPQERREFFESIEHDSSDGDTVDEILAAGVITQEQADNIRAYLAEQ